MLSIEDSEDNLGIAPGQRLATSGKPLIKPLTDEGFIAVSASGETTALAVWPFHLLGNPLVWKRLLVASDLPNPKVSATWRQLEHSGCLTSRKSM